MYAVSISSVMGTIEASKMAAMVLPGDSMLIGHFSNEECICSEKPSTGGAVSF